MLLGPAGSWESGVKAGDLSVRSGGGGVGTPCIQVERLRGSP